MRHLRPLTFALLAFALALPLVSCGSSDDSAKPDAEKSKESEKDKPPQAKMAKVDPICPQVAVVRSLETFRDFGHETPAANQLVSAAKLTGIEGDCSYTDEGIDVAFNVNIVAKRGPRLGGRHVTYPYFVAVVDPDGKILNKNQMAAEINFASDEQTANDAEALHVFIPLTKKKRSNGPYYRVLAGFQLSPEQEAQAKAAAEHQ